MNDVEAESTAYLRLLAAPAEQVAAGYHRKPVGRNTSSSPRGHLSTLMKRILGQIGRPHGISSGRAVQGIPIPERPACIHLTAEVSEYTLVYP